MTDEGKSGMMKLIPHLSFNGECEAAFTLYAACFRGEIAFLMRYSESSAPHAPELADKIFHATLKMGDGTLTGVDVAREKYERPRGFSLQLNLTDRAEAERIFSALSEGGVVQLPLQTTSWADAFGVVVDRFGTPWEINCGRFD